MTGSVRIHAFGDANVLRIEDVVVGGPAPDEVRLRIHAIGVNRTEITLRSGRSPAAPQLPTGIGFEAAGIIDAIGEDVRGWAAGDRVALVPAYSAAQYALYGELAVAPARSLVAIPDTVGFVEAAATWAAFGTAWSGLLAVGALRAGQTVLIPAASSSVGLAAIEIANSIGAQPIALTRTSAKTAALRELGAIAAIATSEQDVVAEVKALTGGKGADLVFDPVGGPSFETLTKATAAGGLLILYGALDPRPTVVPPFEIFARDLTVRGLALAAVTRNDIHLAALKQFVNDGLSSGRLRPTIAKTFPFEQIADAHRFMEASEQVGKIVVTL